MRTPEQLVIMRTILKARGFVPEETCTVNHYDSGRGPKEKMNKQREFSPWWKLKIIDEKEAVRNVNAKTSSILHSSDFGRS